MGKKRMFETAAVVNIERQHGDDRFAGT